MALEQQKEVSTDVEPPGRHWLKGGGGRVAGATPKTAPKAKAGEGDSDSVSQTEPHTETKGAVAAGDDKRASGIHKTRPPPPPPMQHNPTGVSAAAAAAEQRGAPKRSRISNSPHLVYRYIERRRKDT